MPKKSPKSTAALEAEVLKLKAKLKAAEAAAEPEPDDETLIDDSLPGESKVSAIVEALNDTGTVDIYRVEPNGKRVQMGTHDFSSLDEWKAAMDSILRIKGGGDYLCIFRDSKGQQLGQVKRSYDPEIFKAQSAEAKPAAGAAPSLDFAKLLEIQAMRDAEHRKEVETLRLEMMRMNQENTRVILEMVKATQTTPLKTMQDLAAAKQLFVDKEDPLERMLDLRDLMGELRGEARREESSPLVNILERFAEGLSAKAGPRKAHTPPAAPAPKLAAPAPLPNPPAPAPAPASTSLRPEPSGPAPVPSAAPPVSAQAVERPSLDVYRESLALAIEKGMTPQEVAKTVVDRANDAELDTLEVLLERGDWDGLLKDPFLSQHKPWFDAFRAALKDNLAALEVEPAA